MEVDYTVTPGTFYGGDLNDIDLPRVRYWPNGPRKRPVDVKITTLRGSSIGAIHYYLTVEEAYNELWNPTEKRWVKPWDYHRDNEGCGFECKLSFTTYDQAAETAKFLVNLLFSDESKYQIHWDYGTHRHADFLKQVMKIRRQGD
jgi:hypothetical protein